MTGEIAARSRLPVGGIREKVLAAHRAGIRRVILPRRNAADLEDVPRELQDEIEFVLLDRVEQAVVEALDPPATSDRSPVDELPVPALQAVCRADSWETDAKKRLSSLAIGSGARTGAKWPTPGSSRTCE